MAREAVFLSYRREDGRDVGEVRNAVRSAGYDVVDEPSEVIRNAAFFVACVSANGHAEGELQSAIEQIRSGARDKSWLMVVRLGECAIPALQVVGFATLPEFVVRLGDLESRLGEPATARLDLNTEAGDVMAPRAEVFALKAEEEAIRGKTITSKTKTGKVVGDQTAVVGVILTTKGSRKP